MGDHTNAEEWGNARIGRSLELLSAGPDGGHEGLDLRLAVLGRIVGQLDPIAVVDVFLELGVVDVALDVECARIDADVAVRAHLYTPYCYRAVGCVGGRTLGARVGSQTPNLVKFLWQMSV